MDSLNRHYSFAACCCGILILSLGGFSEARSAVDPYGAWDATLTPAAKIPFPQIAPFDAEYRFGWEGLRAGGAKVHVMARDAGRRKVIAHGGPDIWIRKLWNYDATYVGESGGNGEIPSWFHMDEAVSKGEFRSDAFFREGGLSASHRFLWENKPWEVIDLPGVRDLFSAMLFIRSQPLKNGDRIRVAVFPDRNPYLVDLTVAGRDTLTVMGKKIRAIRFTLSIQSIETHGEHKGRLAPHRKFHSGRIWMSDDDKRLPLRAEVDLFIGRVFAEMISYSGV